MQFKEAEKLSDVLERIRDILEYFRAAENPLGYFAALYTKVAHGIEQAIHNEAFDDNARLATLDIHFVNYYIRAMNAAIAGKPAPAHWQLAVDAAQKPGVPVLDHLFLTMNAHINFDLSNAVADSIPASDVIGFKGDFLKVNDILFSLLDNVQADVARFVYPLRWYLRLGEKADDRLLTLVMKLMRNDAYAFACMLALCTEEERAVENQIRMQEVVQAGQKLLAPKAWWATLLIHVADSLEQGNVRSKIDQLLK